MNTPTPQHPTRQTALPTPSSLRAAAQMAARQGEPLVVLVSLHGCVFCDVVRNHYLGPMHQRGECVAVQVDMHDRQRTLQTIDGHTSNPHAQVQAWGARVAPTVLFLNDKGAELAERLEGMGIADFYGVYLQDHLDSARARVRAS